MRCVLGRQLLDRIGWGEEICWYLGDRQVDTIGLARWTCIWRIYMIGVQIWIKLRALDCKVKPSGELEIIFMGIYIYMREVQSGTWKAVDYLNGHLFERRIKCTIPRTV